MTTRSGGTTFLQQDSLENVLEWFRACGGTDEQYLTSHWARFKNTYEFTAAGAVSQQPLVILDMGCHWLHNAFLYANRGHRLICSDAPDLAQLPNVREAARRMNAELRPTTRMEIGDSLTEIAESSVDLVLFCEIIEHMAFNPIPFWKELYRVLKPGGRIIVTTPNSFYHRSLTQRIERLVSGDGYGLTVDEIMQSGTYGHHWKEFSLPELMQYFSYLSGDFAVSRYKMVTHDFDVDYPLGGIESIIAKSTDVYAHNIYLEVILGRKELGIQVSPPWIPL